MFARSNDTRMTYSGTLTDHERPCQTVIHFLCSRDNQAELNSDKMVLCLRDLANCVHGMVLDHAKRGRCSNLRNWKRSEGSRRALMPDSYRTSGCPSLRS